MNKDIESGIEHVANEVVLQIGNTQKWNDMFSERVRNAIDRAAYDVFIEMYFDDALDESNIETAVKWLSEYDYVSRAFCGVGYAIELTDGYGELSEQAVVQYAINLIFGDGRYYPVLDEDDYERRETAWLRDYFDGEMSDDMLGGADRDAVFEAWRDDADPVSGDMYFDMEKLPCYIETAKGGKRNA